MSEADDIREFMGLVGKGRRKGVLEAVLEITQALGDHGYNLISWPFGFITNPPRCSNEDLKTWVRLHSKQVVCTGVLCSQTGIDPKTLPPEIYEDYLRAVRARKRIFWEHPRYRPRRNEHLRLR